MFKIVLCVFLGSGIGGVMRYGVSRVIDGYISRNYAADGVIGIFPWSTLLVNVVGCFIIGLLYGILDSGVVNMNRETRLLLTTGFCGGLTTFSTFAHENYLMFQSNQFGVVALYISVSVILGFAAAWLGHASLKLI